MRKINATTFDLVLMTIVFAGSFGFWEVAVGVLEVPAIVLPKPSEVVVALVDGFSRGIYIEGILITVGESLLGFAFSALLGITLGALFSEFPLLHKLVYPYIVILQSLPKIAIAPLVLVWMGYGLSSKVACAVLVSFFAVLINTIEGFRSTESDQMEMMKALRCSRWQIFRTVKFPNALPFIMTGLELAVIFSLLGAIVGEFVGARQGLGVTLLSQQGNLDVSGMFATLALLAMIGLTFHWAVGYLHRRIVFWRHDSQVVAT